jgi:hypothetical protein
LGRQVVGIFAKKKGKISNAQTRRVGEASAPREKRKNNKKQCKKAES